MKPRIYLSHDNDSAEIEVILPTCIYRQVETMSQLQNGSSMLTLFISKEEHSALEAVAKKYDLGMHELLWCGVDCLMNSKNDTEIMEACVAYVVDRFHEKILPGWATE